ncbi:2-amino-4-hydroxy-6-hydroxymethyldihydropteridine diphosphokinase [Lentibacillus salinarum]|uniref:2-amino-4-hydroxy-6-hydroxymethyldihydropteridine diphosphokinase n=1 Tax=Lentibacillus salinarum TaxID=446820 RepID=A0ABW3ZWY7_9BACI
MNHSYLALGSNIEPRKDYLQQAVNALNTHQHITVTKESFIYETAPVGYTDQADFLNMVVEVETSLSSWQLLDVCQGVEQQLGRRRGIRFGPRTVDLDILIYNQENRETERLTLPHPRMLERAFVLIPLGDIAPELTIPSTSRTIADYMKELPDSDIEGVAHWTENGSAEE